MASFHFINFTTFLNRFYQTNTHLSSQVDM